MVHDWSTLTTTELADIDRASAIAVLPLGATEQHGPHLPLSTDTDIADGLLAAACERVGDDVTLLCLPPIAVGASAEHASYAGTLSVPAETLAATLRALGAGVAAAGVRRLALLNAHGGNNAAMDIAGLDLRRDHGLLVVKLHYPRLAIDVQGLPADELAHGIHGGALETALMLHLQPARVRSDALPPPSAPAPGMPDEDVAGRVAPEGEARIAWLAEDLDPSGIAGDPRRADAALGARLAEAYARAIADVLTETAARPVPPGRG